MNFIIVQGDLLSQPVQVIVNAWNRNIIPWWLLLPQGVSGAIKRKAGIQPFRELARSGPIPLGQAVKTGPGRLPFQAIIHVAGINMMWRSSERSVKDSVQNAMKLVIHNQFSSVAFPLIGAGSGGSRHEQVRQWMTDALQSIPFEGEVRLVEFRKEL
ncbi:MAG: macro domain-containing protein [Planctomycetota bacterium]